MSSWSWGDEALIAPGRTLHEHAYLHADDPGLHGCCVGTSYSAREGPCHSCLLGVCSSLFSVPHS